MKLSTTFWGIVIVLGVNACVFGPKLYEGIKTSLKPAPKPVPANDIGVIARSQGLLRSDTVVYPRARVLAAPMYDAKKDRYHILVTVAVHFPHVRYGTQTGYLRAGYVGYASYYEYERTYNDYYNTVKAVVEEGDEEKIYVFRDSGNYQAMRKVMAAQKRRAFAIADSFNVKIRSRAALLDSISAY